MEEWINNYKSLEEHLLQWPRFRKDAEFVTVKALMSGLGYRDEIPMIHIVGTNGKGSVATMVTEMIQAHGLKVGRFTSPHLIDFRERMTVDGQKMSEDNALKNYEVLSNVLNGYIKNGGNNATFFEMMFLMALMYFKDEDVDVMVMEAGIGGGHDTTNVLENRWLNIITPISLDHAQVLGDTIEQVASEKASIIRGNVPTIAWSSSPSVEKIIRGIAEANSNELTFVDHFNGNVAGRTKETIDFSLNTQYYYYDSLRLNMSADYQLNNAALAVEAVHALKSRHSVEPDKVREGLRKAVWPGRMSYIYPWLLVDGGHNVAGLEQFVEHMNLYENHSKVDILFSCMGDKDYERLCQILLGVNNLRNIYLYKLPIARALTFDALAATFELLGFNDVIEVSDLASFLNKRIGDNQTDVVGAVGSLYLVGELMAYTGGRDSD